MKCNCCISIQSLIPIAGVAEIELLTPLYAEPKHLRCCRGLFWESTPRSTWVNSRNLITLSVNLLFSGLFPLGKVCTNMATCDSTVKPQEFLTFLFWSAAVSYFILHNEHKSSERLLLRRRIATRCGLDCFLKTGMSVSQRGPWVAYDDAVEQFDFIMNF